jgi:hypothetical protein
MNDTEHRYRPITVVPTSPLFEKEAVRKTFRLALWRTVHLPAGVFNSL